MIERHNVIPEYMYNRAVRGQHMYTPVVVVQTGDHAHIYVAGQTSVLPDGSIGGAGDMGAQIRIVCEKVQQALVPSGQRWTTLSQSGIARAVRSRISRDFA